MAVWAFSMAVWAFSMAVWAISMAVWATRMAVWAISMAVWAISMAVWAISMAVWAISMAVWAIGRAVWTASLDPKSSVFKSNWSLVLSTQISESSAVSINKQPVQATPQTANKSGKLDIIITAQVL